MSRRRLSPFSALGSVLVASVLALGLVSAPRSGAAGSTALPWPKVLEPSHQPAQAIGGYSRGCLAGGQALPLRSLYWAVAKPSRHRFHGHPTLIAFIQSYARSLHEHGLGPLIVGDLGQARGGPAPSGHKSHQSGLDVDLWYHAPTAAKGLPNLADHALERVGALSLLSADTAAKATFDSAIDDRLRRAVLDPNVDRVFVHPKIKQVLCERAGNQRKWLQKIRPWWGHDAHFHVRLRCPVDSPKCEAQPPLPVGDGCEELAWWFDPQAQTERESGRESYRQDMGKPAALPPQCDEVLLAKPRRG